MPREKIKVSSDKDGYNPVPDLSPILWTIIIITILLVIIFLK